MFLYKRIRPLQRDGFEDLLQESLMHWYSRRDMYDEKKQASKKTYMKHVVVHKILDLLEAKLSVGRSGFYRSISLDELMSGLDEDAYPESMCQEDENFEAAMRSDIGEAIDRAMAQLSRRQKKLCQLVRSDGLNMNEVSHILKVPRATLFDETLRIREVFRKEGLKDYL